MEKWSLSAEVLAFILILMIQLFSFDKTQVKGKTLRRKLFDIGIGLALGSTLLNAVCVYTIEHYDEIPHWLNMVLNNAYFYASVWMATMVAAYLFRLFLEHVYDKSCWKKAVTGLGILMSVYTVIVIANFWTGCLFYFDNRGNYHRGVLNQSGYVIMMIELGMVGMCYFRNQVSIEKRVVRVMKVLPMIIILLGIFQILFPTLLLNGTIVAVVYMIIFVNFQNLHEERDSLTRIGTRKCFYNEVALRQKSHQEFQIVMVSLNDFAVVNQKFGHRKGDEFLYHIAQWMDERRKEGRAFRFGNVTFALLCPYKDSEDAKKLLHEVESRFKKSWKVGEVECTIPARFGAMSCTNKEREATEIIEILSYMMEISKTMEKGTGMVEFGVEIEHRFQQKKNLLLLLRDSVEKKRFEVWYQPIYDCKTQRFVSAEALLRLKDYNGNMVSPVEFIPLAEENGMIEEIGWIVWESVCRFLGSYPELTLKNISVNMSMQQFMNPKLCERIEECLERNKITADKIKMEITERVVLYDMAYMQKLMEEFAPRGFQFCMDDFGTGYSNFSSVMHLPFEFVKLDRSLLKELPNNEKDMMVVRSMIDLFHSMGIKIVCEGVETKEQKKLLHEMGTDFIQGFYYARPMPEEELIRFLKDE